MTFPANLPVLSLAVTLFVAGFAQAEPTPQARPGAGDAAEPRLEDRVWIDAGADAAPGSLRAFLSDGTFVMTSCGETYRLARWHWVDAATVAWDEDGQEIRAALDSLAPDELTLTLELVGGREQRTYRAADVPTVCPDLPR